MDTSSSRGSWLILGKLHFYFTSQEHFDKILTGV